MKIQVLGAAGGEVTGSAYLVRTAHATVLVDAGLFQGADSDDGRNTWPAEVPPSSIDAVVLTHAHLDHTGRLPLLVKLGYEGPVFSTPATMELAGIILLDSAKLQAQDAIRINRKRERAGEDPVQPLYGPEHVEPLADLARTHPLATPFEVARGVRGRFFEAGHILGSASLELIVDDAGTTRTLVFSGDLGPTTLPILREFAPPERADWVFLESTYGDRDHRGYPETVAEFTGIVSGVVQQGGKILVPTFAVGRAQQILYHLAVLFRDGTLPRFPVILDSPMAVEATRVYVRHPELFDEEMQALSDRGVEPFHAAHFRATVTAEESKTLNDLAGPCVILAGSGMCTGGRILHHLKQNLWKPDTHVLIVGYQARGSLGRRLVEREEHVSIHGERIAVRGRIHTLGGFSAHAGRSDLLKWFSHLAPSRPRVILTHGEDAPRRALAERIQSDFRLDCHLPDLGETLE
ncbi:MAG: MBL fold metallo-hydrolase [Verrucomicrobiae bacterium]|nr:MBL fold metallo-hydrolase [Verrucomicrobiae bacterium]